MDRKTLEMLLDLYKGSNNSYRIATDILYGRGINGVDCEEFYSHQEGTRVSGAKYTKDILGTEILGDNIHIVQQESYGGNTYIRHHYIPLIHIVEFVVTEK